jgi:hypothetical protein
MRKITLIVIFMMLRAVVHAQKDSCYAGVYLTENDFVNNHLYQKINTSAPGYQLKFPPVADWKLEVKIVTPDNVYKFPQGSIYGYSECGKRYRYSPGGRLYAIEDFYKVEEIGPLIIYTSVFNSGDEHFYSRDLHSPIKRLNIQNLKRDFRDKPEFIRAAKNMKKKGIHGGLATVDNNGYYKINGLYEKMVIK